MTLRIFKEENYQDFFQDVATIGCLPSEDNAPDWYGYITKQDVDLGNILSTLELPENPLVVDLGCGYCESLLYLGSILNNPTLHGVEMNETYIEHMTPRIVQYNLPITLHEGNFLNHDISLYDIVYSFCPAMTTENYIAYTDYILENMKVGAIWIEMLGHEAKPLDWDSKETVESAIARYDGTVEILYQQDNIIIVKKMV